ncbi:MAG: hypothetical protein HY319_18780 [Armatimonadetes bacterium]|nr:hypothetical protein [Armatimonadota bacterium]
MLDTFDPSGYASPAECVRALKELGIPASHRLGARVFGQGRRGIRFSLAFLEEAQAEGPAAQILFDPAWNDLPVPPTLEGVHGLIGARPAAAVQQNGILHLVIPDEMPTETGLVPMAPAGSVLPQVLGTPEASFTGILWDRKRMEEASLALLDSEDPTELIESFRYLFRAMVTSGQNAMGLLVTSLRRGKLELSREVARQIQDHMDRDLGHSLEDLLSQEPHRMKDALHFLLGEDALGWREVLQAVMIPALTGVIEHAQGQPVVFRALPRLAPLAGGEPERIEAFLDALLRELPNLNMEERVALGQFLVELHSVYPSVNRFLLRRMRSTTDHHAIAFFGNVLSRLELTPEEHSECVQKLVDLATARGLETAIQERLKTSIMNLGKAPLEQLSMPERVKDLDASQRIWLIHLWERYREEGFEVPAERLFLELAVGEILNRRRGSLLALIRSAQLNDRALVERLMALETERPEVISFLLLEAFRMEEPDDAAVLDLLARFGENAVEPAFTRLREEAALESGAAATRLLLFARMAARVKFDEEGRTLLRERAREILGYPIYHAESLPAVWLGLGHLGGVRDLGDDLVEEILELLFSDLHLFPRERLEAVLLAYPAARPERQLEIERRLRSFLSQENADRDRVEATLAALQRFLKRRGCLQEPEQLVADLCRTVLRRGQERSLHTVMREALSYASEGDGVRVPKVWGRSHREQALRILGEFACHRQTPDRLHRMVVVRLFSFLDDWLDAIQQGTDLYGTRDTPLWAILTRVLRRRPGESGLELAVRVGLRLLELHRQVPHHLALEWRETAQRFIVTLIEQNLGAEVIRHGVKLDLRRALMRVLMELKATEEQENPVSLYLLRELSQSPRLDPALKPALVSFLARREGSY